MRLKLSDNIGQVSADLDAFGERVQRVALPRAMNTLIEQADVAIRRRIRDVYGIPAAELSPYLDVVFGSAGDRRWRILAKGRGFPLRLFKPKQTKVGVAFTIKGRTVTFPHAFIGGAKLSGGAFARGRYGPAQGSTQPRRSGRRKGGLPSQGNSGFRPSGETFGGSFAFGFGRLPIQFLRSASPPDALANPEVIKAGQDRVDEQAAAILRRELKAATRGF